MGLEKSELGLRLRNYRLTTAEILYRLPDHPTLLQSYLWQDLDQLPGFPVLRRFLHYWQKELDGKLYRVRVAAAEGIAPSDWQAFAKEIVIQ
ncbi:MAG TPA: Usg family protein [Alphaproteobacteria bacterium]|nr:Usg family protein [Alphaproteobacteria bacterium]